jgi:hypothetical protein
MSGKRIENRLRRLMLTVDCTGSAPEFLPSGAAFAALPGQLGEITDPD